MLKKACIALYILTIIVMAAITIVEKYQGSDYVSTFCYGAWWFSLLWALLAAAAILYIIQRRMRRWWLITLHASFVIILLGALLTHLTARRGMVHLRVGEKTNSYLVMKNGETHQRILPFVLVLNDFHIDYHPGTQAAADYASQLSIIDGDKRCDFTVSMNNIYSYNDIRFYQTSYDPDGRGSVLSLNSDPYGIPITYTGYALLFFSLIYMLIDPRGTFRRLLLIFLVFPFSYAYSAPNKHHPSLVEQQKEIHTLPKEVAEQLGELYILYNDRICPLQTYAIDFTQKLCGKSHYGNYTAEQVLTGFIFWGDEWSNEPIIRIKGGDLKSTLELPNHTSANSFFIEAMGGYILGPHIEQYYQGNHDGFHKQAIDIDDRLNLIMELRRGSPLKIFPWTNNSQTEWLAPTDGLPTDMPDNHRQYIANVFTILYQEAMAGNYDRVSDIITKMQKYQMQNAGMSLPSKEKTIAEHLYNKVAFATILFMVNLTLGFISFFFYLLQLKNGRSYTIIRVALQSLFVLSMVTLSCCLALRWIICGRVPMGNGYESMLTMAWFVMLIILLFLTHNTYHNSHTLLGGQKGGVLLLSFGYLLSGFFLLVSHINQMDPQISHIMPVLNSPLLSIHVGIIMMAYALLALTFICALVAFLLPREAEVLAVLSRIFLYPALTTLGLGIFIGAIWANISWGTYWSWDPKETWALITLMVYAVVVHTQSLPVFRKPRVYHAYMLLAFLTLLMTYFGVNYFLGGMHSYA